MQREITPSAVWKDPLISTAPPPEYPGALKHTTLAHYIISDTCVLCKSFFGQSTLSGEKADDPQRQNAGPQGNPQQYGSRGQNAAPGFASAELGLPGRTRDGGSGSADSAHPAMLKIYLAAFAPADGTDSTDHGRQFDRRVGQAVGVALQPHRRSVPPDYAVCHQRIARAHKQQIAHRDVRVAHRAHKDRVAAANQRRHAPGHNPGRALALDGKALAEKIAGDSRRHLPRGFP